MLTLPTALANHLQGQTTRLTVCWAVTRKDGTVVRGTAHDQPITISSGDFAGTYPVRNASYATDIENKSDGSVSNLETEGVLWADAGAGEIKVEDIEGGFYDQAEAVLFMLDWANPDDGQKVLVKGTLGEFSRDDTGRYRSEVRGLTQQLSQNIVRTYSERCDVRLFGDERCKFDVEAVTRTGTVIEVTSRKVFVVALDSGPGPVNETYYNGGRLLFTAGANSGVAREIKTAVLGSDLTVTLWDEAPADIAVNDTVSIPPGCDRRYETCRDVHDNLVNFRGHGIFAVGKDRLMRGPT